MDSFQHYNFNDIFWPVENCPNDSHVTTFTDTAIPDNLYEPEFLSPLLEFSTKEPLKLTYYNSDKEIMKKMMNIDPCDMDRSTRMSHKVSMDTPDGVQVTGNSYIGKMSTPTKLTDYDDLFDSLIKSDIKKNCLAKTLILLQSPLSSIQTYTPRINGTRNLSTSTLSFLQPSSCKENSKSNQAPVYETGKIYVYSMGTEKPFSNLGSLRLHNPSCMNPKTVLKSVKKTIDDEFKVHSKYVTDFKSQKNRKTITQPKSPPKKQHKRNNPGSNLVEWKPLSIFTAYTDIKSEAIENTDYFDNIPSSSCFGRLNMRVKRAWTRGPNKNKTKKKKLSF